ncbi:Ligand-binding SRPBCC domain-containing protein [Saccharicrinis carchari]|uniref:Ligand-binding SRPBCC domain-containing protein n=1 Tax=Saccharicrinis carchari TaxID=1168039 RepID=A0A521DZV0_SACCC|nr:SRPBCC family protein [Saccharicrinis carchari]SMO77198.1 Ligand-binding SRPBCC domain-containing protein [Saccharicrinis carchari]
MGFYQFKREQVIKASVDEVWDFISSPQNLKKITPEHMGFDIRSSDLPDKIYEGMIISYTVKPMLGIATHWVTEITHLKNKKYFVDEQRVGPYALWHHQHIIEPGEDGVLMKDIVSYKPPIGLFGKLANTLFIRKKLNQIFDHRSKVLDKIFV